MSEHKFPSEVIDLPSEGKLYPKEHPCSSGKLELKYMTAKEEDILTSSNLIQKGLAIDKLLDSISFSINFSSPPFRTLNVILVLEIGNSNSKLFSIMLSSNF